MPTSATNQPKIEVTEGPTYKREIKRFPYAESDVQEVIEKFVIPAVSINPAYPHQEGAGTPIVRGVYQIRVPDSAGGTGKRGGFRLAYHWDRKNGRITKLTIALRKDRNTLGSKAIDKLMSEMEND